MSKVLNQASGRNWQLYNADCIEALQALPSNSIDLTISSPPFGNLYLYSPSVRDMGNVEDDRHFFEHCSYLIPELHRVTTPGRLAVLHCKHLPLYKGSDGVAGFRDFVGNLVRHFTGDAVNELLARLDAMQEARAIAASLDCDLTAFDGKVKQIEDELIWAQSNAWVFHSMVTIWKCPKTEMERTNNHGLLHSQLCKDSSVSRQGMADYLVVLRKWSSEMTTMDSVKPINRLDVGKFRFDAVPYIGTEPPSDRRLRWSDRDGITRQIAEDGVTNPRDFSIKVWQKYASPVWFDMRQTNVLNTDQAREGEEPHICPLALDVIARSVELWSNPGDVVFDPFNGIGSTGYAALKMGRKYIGTELKGSYFKQACKYLEGVESSEQLDLTTLLEVA